MVKRKKTKLENLFNLNRYKKRQGAKGVMQVLDRANIEELKNTFIEGQRPEMFQSYMIKDLNEHMIHLRTAFHCQPELLYYHAQLIVLLRREADIQHNFAKFHQLWESEADFLLQHLNMRWLIAAVDTFIDHHPSDTSKAVFLNAVILINTIKLYETERVVLDHENTSENDYIADKLNPAQDNCFNLFDELPSFRIGVDDTLRNMRWRIDATCKTEPLAHKILINVFDRVNTRGSVYTRFRSCHTKMRNAWWSEDE